MNQNNNPFGNLSTDGLEKTGDSLGGGGILDSGVYAGLITLAFAGASDSGARFLEVHVKLDNGSSYRERMYVTNKQGQNYYERDGKKSPLPGFTTANDLALLATGVDLGSQTFEEKVAKLYDFTAKAEVPTKVQAVTSMMDKRIALAILKSNVDKTAKNESTGNYEPTGQTRDENNIDKVFHAESMKTVSEFASLGKDAKGEFHAKWADKNNGVVKQKAKGAEGKTGTPGRSAPAGGAKPAGAGGSLFS